MLLITATLVHFAALAGGVWYAKRQIEKQAVEDGKKLEAVSTFRRRAGCKSRRYWLGETKGHSYVQAKTAAGLGGRAERSVQIHKLGRPINPVFGKYSRPRAKLREELGLEVDVPTTMVTGGVDGVGGMEAFATDAINTLSKELDRCQVVVICGKNQTAKHKLEETQWPQNSRVLIQGVVSNMDEWMGAVDALVVKAGPGTTAEAAIRGLRVTLSGHFPGQDEGNVSYAVNGGYGA